MPSLKKMSQPMRITQQLKMTEPMRNYSTDEKYANRFEKYAGHRFREGMKPSLLAEYLRKGN